MAWPDAHKNFAYSTIATAPSPAASGTSLVVAAGEGTLFPTAPFNATIWPAGAQPLATNAEIVRVTNVTTDTFTITRTQEGTSARTIVVGDQIAASITAKTFTDVENSYLGSWTPFYLGSAMSGLQTLASASGQSSTGSLFVFPVTIPSFLKFNQVIVPVSLSYLTTSVAAVNNSYASKWGLYSITGETLNLISSNSFSIGETVNSVSLTWNYPTTTHTSGYGYGSFPAGNLTTTAQIQSFVSYSRAVGLHFGGEVALSAGVYWMGIMSQRTSGAASSTHGLSNAGIIGQVINAVNSVGSQSGISPIGVAPAHWNQFNVDLSAWRGRHIIGFLTNTALYNFSGTRIPDSITLSALGAVAAASTVSILPSVTFVST